MGCLNFLEDMGYAVVATHFLDNPEIVTEIRVFHSLDKELIKDSVRFELCKKVGR